MEKKVRKLGRGEEKERKVKIVKKMRDDRSQGLIVSPATRPERNWKGAASQRLERDMVG